MMRRSPVVAAAIALACVLPGPVLALSCEVLQAQIEAKIRRAGVDAFTLTVVAADAQAAGRVVGTCELGTKKIVYRRGAGGSAAASAPRPRAASAPTDRPAPRPIITECRDGTVVVGGECPR